MLKPAIQYREQLEEKLKAIFFDEKYKFLFADGYPEMFEIKNDAWTYIQFVSVYEDEVIGFIEYQILRSSRNARGLSIIGFNNNPIFAKDLIQAIDDIFNKYKIHKITFLVAIDNPVTKTYDKYIEKFGGRVVGVLKEHWKLWDGKYYDVKEYEILGSNYKSLKRS